MEHHNTIHDLLAAYLNKQLSREEFDYLFSKLAELDDDDFKKTVLQTLENQPDTIDSAFIHQRIAQLYPQLQSKIQEEATDTAVGLAKPRRSRFIQWAVSAAAVLLIFFLIGRYYVHKNEYTVYSPVLTAEQILPGGNRATLTLADGRTLDLSTEQQGIVMGDGILYTDGSYVLEPMDDNQQTRDHSGNLVSNTLGPMSISTPKGGQYQLTLSDGTKVWLNAASSLSYPATFEGNAREVSLRGEAYFEVTKDKTKPFIVKTTMQQVEVLGTSFNINAYENEIATKTTLLTGSVRVSHLDDKKSDGKSQVLSPNQQSLIGGQSDQITIREIDPHTAIAWKDGFFNFHGLSIDESMKQIERWYDIDVIYEGKKPTGHLGGKMSRGVKLSTFLSFLENDFHLKAELTANRTLLLRTVK